MEEKLRAFRRDLHRIPEIGFALDKTLAYVRGVLGGTGCELTSPVQGGLCAYFDGGGASTVAFRADMDALPVQEATGACYASVHPGQMHACGHDGHTSILLGLALRLAQGKAWPNNALLIFQPAEETTGGAKPICDAGIMERYGVKAVFGLHIWPGLAKGRVFSAPGPVMAKTGVVSLDIYGRAAHAARAEEGADALYAGAAFLHEAYGAAQNMEPAGEKRVLKFGVMRSGTAENAISAHTHIRGTLRAYDEALHGRIAGELRRIAERTAEAAGCCSSFSISEGYPPVCNDPELYGRVLAHLVEGAILPLGQTFLTGEDFSFYQRRAPGVFFFLGTGEDKALHAADFDFDESILSEGLYLYERLMSLPLG